VVDWLGFGMVWESWVGWTMISSPFFFFDWYSIIFRDVRGVVFSFFSVHFSYYLCSL